MHSSNLRIDPNFTPPPDIEPIVVRQTSEPEHLESPRDWFSDAAADASVDEGCTFFRYSHHDDPQALLIEGWAERPADCGEQRWVFSTSDDKEPSDEG